MLEHLPGVTSEMREWTFWAPSPKALSRAQVQAHVEGGLSDVAGTDHDVIPPIDASQPPRGYLDDGKPWALREWSEVAENVFGSGSFRAFGFTVRHASLRSLPTDRAFYRTATDREFDQLQETRLHTFEPVRILAQSGDHQWYWVVSNIATAWIRVEDVAMASDDQWHHYRQVDEPLVVVHTGVVTEPQPYDKAVSNQPIEYGAYLPLYDSDRKWVGNQLQLGHFVVAFPVRNALGQLEVHPALVKNGEAVHQGYLPCSRHELIHSVFALLGDRYAWGDKLGTHDCSSLVMDAYRTLGIQLPRNSGDQARALPLVKQWQASDDFEKRLRDLRAAEPGDLLMMPGHVMMFLGFSGQEPYAIHAFVGYGSNQGGTFHPVLVNAVEVSGLSVPTRRNVPYLGAVTSVVHVF